MTAPVLDPLDAGRATPAAPAGSARPVAQGATGGGPDAVEAAAAVLGDLAARDVPLGPSTTYRVGGAAALHVHAERVEHLDRVAAAVAASGVEVLVLGRGSNLLVADAGFRGLVLTLGAIGGSIDLPVVPAADPAASAASDGEGAVEVVAGGGVPLPMLARRTASAGLRGVEWAVGVPGSVGGGVRMNAGGHGSDVAGCLRTADVYDLRTGRLTTRAPADLGLRFRSSALGRHEVVVSAAIAVVPGDRAAAEAEIAEIVRWRREHQPGGQNAGSVFVNPVPGVVTAGALIDGLGLRGLRIGTAEVSTKHANFIQADPGGRAADVLAVMQEVRARVADATGHLMRSEVRLVGFGDAADALTTAETPARAGAVPYAAPTGDGAPGGERP